MNDDLLRAFGTGLTVDEQVSALSTLIRNRTLNRVVKDHNFQMGITHLAEIAGNSKLERERLVAVAALCRIGNIAKSLRSEVDNLLAQNLVDPLAPLRMLIDPDDRFYVASAWRATRYEWWRGYLADAAVEEETAERVRAECLEGLCVLCAHFEDVLEQLRGPLRKLRFATEHPDESMGRRVRRILAALRTSFESAQIEPGTEAGTKFAGLVRDAFRSSGVPQEIQLTGEVAEETASLVHGLIRARFSLATAPSTYEAMDVVRSWFTQSQWEIFVAESRSSALVARDIRESLNLLVRAGVSDDELFQKLTIVVGSPENARNVSRELAEQVAGIPDHIRDWLLGRTPKIRSSLAAESQERGVDEIIADIWIDATKLSELSEVLRADTLPQIVVVAPRIADSIKAFVDVCESLLGALRLLAHRRSLRIRGKVGQELEFSPLDQDMIGGPKPGIRRVRIIRPIVESLEHDGAVRVVRKGLVEPAGGSPPEP